MVKHGFLWNFNFLLHNDVTCLSALFNRCMSCIFKYNGLHRPIWGLADYWIRYLDICLHFFFWVNFQLIQPFAAQPILHMYMHTVNGVFA